MSPFDYSWGNWMEEGFITYEFHIRIIKGGCYRIYIIKKGTFGLTKLRNPFSGVSPRILGWRLPVCYFSLRWGKWKEGIESRVKVVSVGHVGLRFMGQESIRRGDLEFRREFSAGEK